jgi:hypothetical protein
MAAFVASKRMQMRYFHATSMRDETRRVSGPVVWAVFAALALLLGGLIYFGAVHGNVSNNKFIVPTNARTDQRKTR